MREQQTLGRRIQEARKAAGLSQESLGERLGVSRQAVSKWEADAAVPELENLIAMSRIFGVTIGALLGVEPEAAEDRSEGDAPEAPGEGVEGAAPAGELTDRELAAVEAIVRKYLEAVRRPRWSRRKKIAVSAGICGAALAAALALGSGFSALGSRLDQVQGQVYGIESSVGSQIGALAGQIRDILNEDSNLFAVSQAQVTDYDLTAETVTLQVSAQAKSWQDNTTALFTALLSDGRQFSAEASGKNGTFTAQNWTLPMDQEILLSASLTTDGVTAADQLETLYDCLPGNFRLDVWGGFSQTDWSNQWTDFQGDSWPQTSKRLTLGGLSLSINSYGGDSHSGPAPTEVELCFFRDQETVPESSIPVPEALELWAEAGFVEMYDWTDYTFTCELLPEETLTAAVRITDDHGQTTWTILCAYRLDRSGNVQTPQDLPADWHPGDLL
ncbi:helix-turn-helix domain-containing protein [Dysosmobacter sp.]|uniref:helix-turn-helix domain-containing protein n=1 Tax=Dysosmobacter sp. TaxID=2591382 RepID=UPI003AF0ABDE